MLLNVDWKFLQNHKLLKFCQAIFLIMIFVNKWWREAENTEMSHILAREDIELQIL